MVKATPNFMNCSKIMKVVSIKKGVKKRQSINIIRRKVRWEMKMQEILKYEYLQFFL